MSDTTFKKGKKPGPGRPPGTPNKVGAAAKQVIAEAAEKLGGVDRLVEWAQEDPANEKAFWASVYPKLLPLTVAGDPENPLNVGMTVTFVAPNGKPS